MENKEKAIVAILAHSDDIEYSLGGTFAKYSTEGYRTLYGVLSRCNSGWTVSEKEGGHYVPSSEIIPRRRQEAENAAKVFGSVLFYGDLLENCHTTLNSTRIAPSFSGAQCLGGEEALNSEEIDAPAGTLLSVAAGAGVSEPHPAVKQVADLLIEWKPALVIGQSIGNFNPDHFAAAQILAIAWQLAKQSVDIGPYWMPVNSAIKNGYSFPPLQASHYVDVTGYENIALRALACHTSQGGHMAKAQNSLRRKWKEWGKIANFKSAEAFFEVYT